MLGAKKKEKECWRNLKKNEIDLTNIWEKMNGCKRSKEGTIEDA